ncbi:MAG: sigma-70 family RNA polymerase sigma factor [Hyphomicrobium sp.]
MTTDRDHVTAIVASLGDTGGSFGTTPSAEDLLPIVYEELRGMAHHYLKRERSNHTLQPTALVHEAYLRMVDGTKVNWQGRTHFFAVGAQVMRRVLIDYARERGAAKRGGDLQRVTFSDATPAGRELNLEELLTLDTALQKLAKLDPRQAKIVELRFFAGLTVEEIAGQIGVSKRTVEGDWTHARAWLSRELSESGES